MKPPAPPGTLWVARGGKSRTLPSSAIAMHAPQLPQRVGNLWWAVALSLVLGASAGCVQRRFTIRSNPPGALVYVDDYEIGSTPCSTDFTYYGTRKIRLVKDGYETLTVLQPVPAPWYQFPGIDFVSENLVPGEIRDERILDYQMQPQVIVPTEQLLGRAEGLRQNVSTAAAASGLPVPPTSAPPTATGVPPAGPPVLPGPVPQTTPAEPLPPPRPALPPPVGFDRFNY